jgi:hypothetical protein
VATGPVPPPSKRLLPQAGKKPPSTPTATRPVNAPSKVQRILGNPDTTLERVHVGIYDALDALVNAAHAANVNITNVQTGNSGLLAYTTVSQGAGIAPQERVLDFSLAFSVADEPFPVSKTGIDLATLLTPGTFATPSSITVDKYGRVSSITAGAGGSGITQLTQDVLAGPGSGSQAASVVQVSTVNVLPFNLAGQQNISKQGSGALLVGTSIGSTLNLYSNSITQLTLDAAGTQVQFPVGLLDITAIALPATPAAGHGRTWFDSTSLTLAGVNNAGTRSSMAFGSTAGAHQFLTAFSALTGTFTQAQPSFADLSGSLWTLTAGAMAFIDSTGHLVNADGNNNFWDNTNKRQIIGRNTAYVAAAGPPLTVSNVGTLGSNGDVAIGLDEALTQAIGKINGTLYVGTFDSNSLSLLTNNFLALTIDTSQNTSLANGLTVAGFETIQGVGTFGGNATVALALSQAGGQNIAKTGGTFGVATLDSNHLQLSTNATTAVDIDTVQNVLMSGGRLEEKGFSATVTSASDITVTNSGGNTLVVTGTTTINRISSTNWQNGAHLRLIFTTAITIKHLGVAASGGFFPISLWGAPVAGVTVDTTAGYTLNLVFTGSVWQEVVESAYTTIGSASEGGAPTIVKRRSIIEFDPVFTVQDDTTNGGTNISVGLLNASSIPSFSGAITTVSGSTVASVGIIPGRFLGRQVLTSGTTYTPTSAAVKQQIVRGWAGGGGGGGVATTATTNAFGGGGASGGYFERLYSINGALATGTFAIGGGGTAGANTGGTGGTGGNTTFTDGTTLCTANGGLGGVGMTAANTNLVALGGSAGAVSTNGNVNGAGSPGGYGFRLVGAVAGDGVSGSGASSALGGGGTAKNAGGAGSNATGFASGGGGAAQVANSSAAVGGTGSGGIIIVEEFS